MATLSGRIAFSSGRAVDFDIWSLDLSTGVLTQLTHGDNLNDFPSYSPDGNSIAYVSTQEDLVPSLWVMKSDGSGKKRLTTQAYCQHPIWTKDGKGILFSTNALDGNDIDICRLDVPSGSIEKLLSLKGAQSFPDLSPCGTKLLVTSEAGTNLTDIVEIDLKSGNSKTLVSHPSKDTCARYSPNGSKIAFVSYRDETKKLPEDIDRRIAEAVRKDDISLVNKLILQRQAVEGDSEIFIMNKDASDLKQLTTNTTSDTSLCWSPCGRFIAHTSCKKGSTETERLEILDVETGRDHTLKFDRSALEAEIGASASLNASIFQKVVPDWIERKFIHPSFWGEERNPTWTAA